MTSLTTPQIFCFAPIDEAAHRAGGVDHEDQFDRRLVTGDVFDLSGRVILSPRGRRRQ